MPDFSCEGPVPRHVCSVRQPRGDTGASASMPPPRERRGPEPLLHATPRSAPAIAAGPPRALPSRRRNKKAAARSSACMSVRQSVAHRAAFSHHQRCRYGRRQTAARPSPQQDPIRRRLQRLKGREEAGRWRYCVCPDATAERTEGQKEAGTSNVRVASFQRWHNNTAAGVRRGSLRCPPPCSRSKEPCPGENGDPVLDEA